MGPFSGLQKLLSYHQITNTDTFIMYTLHLLLAAVSVVLCQSQSVTIRNYPGTNAYWLAVSVEAPEGAYVTSMKVKDSNMDTFEEGLGVWDYYHGQFFQWSNYLHYPYTGPFSFQVTLNTGQVLTGTNTISGFSPSDEGTISMAGGMAFVNAGEEETATTTEQGLSSGAIAGLVIVGVMFGCLMGALCMVCYQKRNKVVQSGPQMEKVEDEEVMVDVRVTNSMQLEA